MAKNNRCHHELPPPWPVDIWVPEPEMLEDYLPKLRAIDLLLKVERERRTIIGHTAPSRRVLVVITEDQLERALRQYNEEAEALERDTAEIEARRTQAS